MLAVARVAICPGALDVSARGVDDPRHVVHLTVAVPHVHDGSGERFVDALLPGDLRWRVPSRSAVTLGLPEELAIVIAPGRRSLSAFACCGWTTSTLERRRAPAGWGGCLRADAVQR